MNSMEGVPLKMPDDAAQEVIEDVKVTAPDYLNMLRETQVCSCILPITVMK